jgi:glycosyl transferase family 28
VKRGVKSNGTSRNALETECYSKASSAAFISVFLINVQIALDSGTLRNSPWTGETFRPGRGHILLSTIGPRGDVQPLVALALELRATGYESRLCAPPNFRDLVEGHGLSFVPVGPIVRHVGRERSATAEPSPEDIRQLVTDTIAGQFATLGEAALGFDVIVATTALQ